MQLNDRIFRNNKTGETIKVIDSFDNVAILENKQKISIKNLTDPDLFTEQIDPKSFFNNSSTYNLLAQKIKSINSNNLYDDPKISKANSEFMPSTNEPAIIETNEDYERELLARKYNLNSNISDEINNQNEKFNRILNPENENNDKVYRNSEYQEPVRISKDIKREEPVEDPITSMFKNVKRNIEFKISIDLNEKIPRLDFIEMMEDSYEISIIDYLADDFTKKILNNPNLIKDLIKNKITNMVFGDDENEYEIEVPEIKDDLIKEETIIKKEESKKLTAKDRIDLINSLSDIDEIKRLISNEKAKTVLSAADSKIKELKTN